MPDKPNILVIWGDDIGITNLSCYSDGLMGYRTPNIDRIASEGMRFTDSYGEQIPNLYNLRTDPYERADVTSNTYYDWFLDHAYLVLAAQSIVVQFLETFRKFPPRQKPASFTIDQALERMQDAAVGHH